MAGVAAPSNCLQPPVACGRPHGEYASTVWDPSTKKLQHERDKVQNSAIRFICKLKGRDTVTKALEKLNVQMLGDWRKTSRHNLLLTSIL